MNQAEKNKLKDKAKKVLDAIEAKHGDEPFAEATRFGTVQVERVGQVTNSEGATYVEVFLRGDTVSTESHFRIWNPPINVKNPDGTLREDPVLALAEVIAQEGGRAKRPKF